MSVVKYRIETIKSRWVKAEICESEEKSHPCGIYMKIFIKQQLNYSWSMCV